MPRQRNRDTNITVNIQIKHTPPSARPTRKPPVSIGTLSMSSVNIQQNGVPANAVTDEPSADTIANAIARLRYAILHEANELSSVERVRLDQRLTELLPRSGESKDERALRASRAAEFRETLGAISSLADLVVVAWPVISLLWS